MPTLDDVKSFLEKQEGGKDLLETIVSSIESEKQRGILESQKANKEAQNLRKYKIALEGLGYNPEETELENFIGSLKEVKEQGSKAKETKMTLESLTKDFTDLKTNFEKNQTELAKERKLASELKDKTIKQKIREQLSQKLGQTIYGADLIIESLISNGRVTVDDSGEKILFKEGDNTLDLDSGVKKFLESRPDIIKNNQQSGAGSQPTTSTVSDPNSDSERLKTLRKLGRNIF